MIKRSDQGIRHPYARAWWPAFIFKNCGDSRAMAKAERKAFVRAKLSFLSTAYRKRGATTKDP